MKKNLLLGAMAIAVLAPMPIKAEDDMSVLTPRVVKETDVYKRQA